MTTLPAKQNTPRITSVAMVTKLQSILAAFSNPLYLWCGVMSPCSQLNW
ncbi:hypothetical protein GPLA_3870 [Paraglaciecola polaris LMG 21857]|uniref:Uncharacterized protein n=1 Tax=Paraglaciecola polaris LMG 21857 TaxID=1129793 RepID=K7AHN5_9ALTE|nr:hypothetical protein GPLA_3870 [Paraglaciecola polaris LMG 21857]